eukprot:1158089-Pelagomonas_calceolata.AAC.1
MQVARGRQGQQLSHAADGCLGKLAMHLPARAAGQELLEHECPQNGRQASNTWSTCDHNRSAGGHVYRPETSGRPRRKLNVLVRDTCMRQGSSTYLESLVFLGHNSKRHKTARMKPWTPRIWIWVHEHSHARGDFHLPEGSCPFSLLSYKSK